MTTSTAAGTPYRDCSPSASDSIRALVAILAIGLGFLPVFMRHRRGVLGRVGWGAAKTS
jgi:hypothetical protein